MYVCFCVHVLPPHKHAIHSSILTKAKRAQNFHPSVPRRNSCTRVCVNLYHVFPNKIPRENSDPPRVQIQKASSRPERWFFTLSGARLQCYTPKYDRLSLTQSNYVNVTPQQMFTSVSIRLPFFPSPWTTKHRKQCLPPIRNPDPPNITENKTDTSFARNVPVTPSKT